MATTLLHKRSSTSGDIPTTSSLALGELAINTIDGYLFIKTDDGTTERIVRFRGDPSSEASITHDTFSGDGSTTQFTVSQVAEDVGCCVQSVKNWIRTLNENNPRLEDQK